MSQQDLDSSMSDIRDELTRITQALTKVDHDSLHTMQMRRTQLLTQLQHMEMLRWFAPQLAQTSQMHRIPAEVTLHESKPV